MNAPPPSDVAETTLLEGDHGLLPDRAVVASHVLAAVFPLEILQAEVDDAIVKVLAAKMGVASGRLHLEDTSAGA